MAPSVEERTVSFGDDNAWLCRVAGDGPPLLWLHGLWGEPAWEPHLAALAENHRVYAPVLPGYDGSSVPDGLTGVGEVAMLAAEFLNALDLSGADVVGHSIGGWVGAELAVFRPGKAARLVVIDPLGMAIDWTQIPNILYNNPASVPGFFFTDSQSEGARRYCPLPAEWNDAYINNRIALVRLAFKPYMHDPKLAVRLRFVTCPTLVLWGAGDRFVGSDHSERWAAALPQSEVRHIDGAGHYPHVEQTELCLQEIENFLAHATETRK